MWTKSLKLNSPVIWLIGLTFFVTIDVYSSWDRDAGMSTNPLMTFVYGYTQVRYSYEFPKVTSYHSVYVANDSGIHPDWPGLIPVKYYVDFSSMISGGELHFPFPMPQDWSDEGWLAGTDTVGMGRNFEFDLSNQPIRQEYTITADSKLKVKVDHNGDGIWDVEDDWSADISEVFEHREEALGIDDW